MLNTFVKSRFTAGKKIYSLLSAIILFTSASAQWSIIYSNTIAPLEELRGCFFTSASNGIVVGATTVVGNPAIIWKTTDGGATWTTITNIYTDTLRSVWFTNDTTGFACGAKGRIIRTFDAGLTWDTVPSGVNYLLRSIYFTTPEIGYICGGNGVILKTADGGNTWSQLSNPITQDMINIRFLGTDTGYACSSLGTFLNGYVIRTYDAGATWNVVDSNAQGLLGIAIANTDTIVSGGGTQTIVRTTDGGQTWSTVYTGAAATNMRGSWFPTTSRGYMVGDIGSLFKTANGGLTWTPVTLTTAGLLGIHFPNPDTGYAVGNGTIIKYITPCTPPPPGPMSGGSSACSLDTTVYCVPSIPGATWYQWTVPAGNAIISGQGDTCVTIGFGNLTSGNITCTATNPCGIGDTTTLAVTVNPSPGPPFITLVGNQLMSSTANNIQWNLNGVPLPGDTNQYLTPLQNGLYTVTYTNPFGCTAESQPYNILNTGISALHSPSAAFIYPNPADKILTVRLPENISAASIIVCDAAGRKVLSTNTKFSVSPFITCDVSSIEDGLYFIFVETEKGMLRGNVVIEHLKR